MALRPWLIAARPRTLALSLTPVMVGAALAWAVQRELPNNYRDVEADTRVGRRTLPYWRGATARHGSMPD